MKTKTPENWRNITKKPFNIFLLQCEKKKKKAENDKFDTFADFMFFFSSIESLTHRASLKEPQILQFALALARLRLLKNEVNECLNLWHSYSSNNPDDPNGWV